MSLWCYQTYELFPDPEKPNTYFTCRQHRAIEISEICMFLNIREEEFSAIVLPESEFRFKFNSFVKDHKKEILKNSLPGFSLSFSMDVSYGNMCKYELKYEDPNWVFHKEEEECDPEDLIIPEEKVFDLCMLAQSLRVGPLIFDAESGFDGETNVLSFTFHDTSARYEWWSDAPPLWGDLEKIIEFLKSLK